MSAPTPARRPVGRYGPEPDPRARRRTVLALWALGLAGLGLTVWLGLGVAATPVTWQDVGFTLDADRGVDVEFDVVRLDPATPVTCRLEALNEQYAQVGVLTVEIPPGRARVERLTRTVATAEAAVTGIVQRCWVAEG